MYAGVPNTMPMRRQLAAAHRRLGVADELHEPEVDDLRALPAAHVDQHHVVGLEIAMHEALRVRVRDAVEQLARDHERAPRRDGPVRSSFVSVTPPTSSITRNKKPASTNTSTACTRFG